MKNVIDHSSVAAFGDLKEGATVVDHSVRKAWEAFFHLDFDYSWLPEIRRYVPGLSQVRQSCSPDAIGNNCAHGEWLLLVPENYLRVHCSHVRLAGGD